MGFKDAKKRIIQALHENTYQHEARNAIASKNLLQNGDILASEVIHILLGSRGSDHQQSAHHVDPSVVVHVIRQAGWYIKFYFLEPDAWFISVHKSMVEEIAR